ncbi:MAG: hypothetical protein AAFZ65_03220, partial [Planctomycetota bacterium]
MRLALLAPTFPTRSETFVFREAAALEALGCHLTPFALRASPDVPREARTIGARTQVLYTGWGRIGLDLAGELLGRPVRTLGVLGCAARDALRGRFASRRSRLLAPLQALAGIALARRL